MEIMETKKLNLCEILKDCPKGTKLYSHIIGECKLDHITSNLVVVEYVNNLGDSLTRSFFKDGKASMVYYGECILFPSKDNRDWSTFKSKKERFDPKTLKPFDKVLGKNDYCWIPTIFSYYHKWKEKFIAIPYKKYCKCIPCNDETAHLAGTTDEAPEYYKWWEE